MMILDISAAAFEEIKERLRLVQLDNHIGYLAGGATEAVNLDGILLRSEDDERVKVFILFQGKRINDALREARGEGSPRPEDQPTG